MVNPDLSSGRWVRNVRDHAAFIANKMVVVALNSIKSGFSVLYEHFFDLPVIDKELQIAVHGAKRHLRRAHFSDLIDFVCGGMAAQTADDLVDQVALLA